MTYELRAKTVVKILDALRLAKEECSSMDTFNELDDLQEEIRKDVRLSVWANSPRGRYLRQIRESIERNRAWNTKAKGALERATKKTLKDPIMIKHMEEKHVDRQ